MLVWMLISFVFLCCCVLCFGVCVFPFSFEHQSVVFVESSCLEMHHGIDLSKLSDVILFGRISF